MTYSDLLQGYYIGKVKKKTFHISDMPPPKDHNAMKLSVCAICFRKPKNLRNISAKVKIQIQEAILSEFDDERFDWLPKMICLTCYKDIAIWKQNHRY